MSGSAMLAEGKGGGEACSTGRASCPIDRTASLPARICCRRSGKRSLFDGNPYGACLEGKIAATDADAVLPLLRAVAQAQRDSVVRHVRPAKRHALAVVAKGILTVGELVGDATIFRDTPDELIKAPRARIVVLRLGREDRVRLGIDRITHGLFLLVPAVLVHHPAQRAFAASSPSCACCSTHSHQIGIDGNSSRRMPRS
jgi:hypothetical protein